MSTLDASHEAAQDGLDLVLFRAAGWLLAVPAQQVLASEMGHPGDAGTPHAAQVLGLDEKSLQAMSNKRLKLFFQEQSMWVDGPVELRHCPATDIHPLPALIQARQRLPGLRALLFHQGQYALIFDLA